MREFQDLVDTLKRLRAPDGCPWDREQTLLTLRRSLTEETYEVIEAIDLDDSKQLREELGDLFLNVVFLCNIAEQEGRFTLQEVLEHIVEKLVRRHPHIFGDVKIETSSEVMKQWEQIKEMEKKDLPKPSLFDTIPKDLPSLAKAQKMINKLTKTKMTCLQPEDLSPEGIAGEALWELVCQLEQQGILAEEALRKKLAQVKASCGAK